MATDRDGQRDEGRAVAFIALRPIDLLNIVVALLLVFAVVGLVRVAPEALTTIAVGSVFGLALDPVVSSIRRRWGWSRPQAVSLVVAAAFALVGTVVGVLGPKAIDQASSLSTDLPRTVAKFYDLPLVGDWLRSNDVAGKIDQAVHDLPGNISDKSLTNTLETLVGGALSAVLVLVVTIAVLLDGEQIVATVRSLIPQRWQARADNVGRVFYTATAQYVGGSLAVAALMGVVVLALCLIFAVPLAPLAAIWAMITDLIPQVGGFLGGALLGLLALTRGPVVFLVVVALYVLYMNIENHLITPAIVGRAVDVTPPTTMLAALIGGAAAGVPGALVATPLVGAIKQLYLQLRWGEQPFQEKTVRKGRVRALLRRMRPRHQP